LDNLGFLGIAYAVVWIFLGAYLIWIAQRQRRLERRLDELEGEKTVREEQRKPL